jgi:hypothetical protein
VASICEATTHGTSASMHTGCCCTDSAGRTATRREPGSGPTTSRSSPCSSNPQLASGLIDGRDRLQILAATVMGLLPEASVTLAASKVHKP